MELMTLTKAAQKLDMSTASVIRLIVAGKLQYVRPLGGNRLLTVESVEQLYKERRDAK